MTEAPRTATEGSGEGRAHRVWDPLVRVVHWSIAGLVLANVALLEEGDPAHRFAGYAVLALVGLRLAWGVVGSRHARFSAFPPSLGGALSHLSGLVTGAARRETHLSHTPLGALMAYALWGLLAAICLSGIAAHTGLLGGGEAGEELHETLANLALAAIALHVGGVILESRLSGVGLVSAMLTGWKRLPRG